MDDKQFRALCQKLDALNESVQEQTDTLTALLSGGRLTTSRGSEPKEQAPNAGDPFASLKKKIDGYGDS